MSGTDLAWIGLLAVLGLWMLGAYNRVTALRGSVLAAWAQVEAILQRRGQALAALLAAVGPPLAAEASALDAVATAQAQVQAAGDALRRTPVSQEGVAELSKSDAVLGAVLVRLVALVEQQPLLLADPAVSSPLQVLRDSRSQLGFARKLFNDAGSAYNQATGQFPTRLLRSMLQFTPAGRL